MVAIYQLIKILQKKYPNWRETVVLLCDNATWHRGKHTKRMLKEFSVPIMATAPYSPSTAPIEYFFNRLKSEDHAPALSSISTA